jgi:hypothetical protein
MRFVQMAEFLPYPSRSVAIASEYTDIGSSSIVPEEDADIIVVDSRRRLTGSGLL